ncbi:protein ACTIVITY OF BC1 COMPLEX KINASE 7 [Citrus sinensis]|uniref:protein ACTIVITY OF BC1 COMPLEX KINASE 7, chloroplastic-like n=1 Tax=Citrus sinensis TaxID=2711 RepID=UPI0003D78729|nr:protein ACTIVITY OF BC1 COMPLEX KINASE 7, chloroplastic-like [Citrus sinensis]XP_024950883.1 protein ACTIVITY OF BC1 COMPLEX KINASE 7, chloroplastic-like [Citrus sinensis]XP_052291097.1 protein ACTIVITY OF BC1 COMPLEX KINASE 7, chloroplastic-like [Citrus sinensis]KAH9745352.1 protein ACTIVITY OF BC1 COMPLEX KINASE 7 [Citrus sinensis]
MVGILASQGCCCHSNHLINQQKTMENLSFSSSVSTLERLTCKPTITNGLFQFLVQMKHTGSPSTLGINGRPVKMVPIGEVLGRHPQLSHNIDTVNGSKQSVNGSVVKRKSSSALVRTPKGKGLKELPPIGELKDTLSHQNFSWSNENYNSLQRSIDIWLFVISFYIRIQLDDTKWTYFGGFMEEKQKKRRKRTASWLRERILQLGPTFMKLGQLSSTRSDLFPREYVDELAKLQDRAPAFSPEKARSLIESELGAPIDQLFKKFEDQPISAASIGQVHRAILHNGEKVVVKVQRPGLKKLFDIDLGNLKLVAKYYKKGGLFGGPVADWNGIYRECSTILYQELNYINEGKNADRFRRDFRNIKWVRVPLVFWDYTASMVLTMEYVPGININELEALDFHGYSRSQISSRAVEAFLIQMLKTGFFHADPHPGNLAVDVDEALIYYDFGMMGEITPLTRDRLLELFFAVYERNAKKVIQSLIDLEALQPTGDLSSVKRFVQFFLDNLFSRPDKEQTLAAVGEDLFAIAHDQPFQFPSIFAFVVRAFSTLEGNGYMLDPDFSFMKVAAPYLQELLEMRQKQMIAKTQPVENIRKQIDHARSSTVSMPYRVQRIEEVVNQLEAGDLKLRVRVLESERAAKKATILQIATIRAVFGGSLLNLGVTLSGQAHKVLATGSFIGAGVFFILFLWSMQRVKELNKIEKMI